MRRPSSTFLILSVIMVVLFLIGLGAIVILVTR
jgi:cell division protein FtsX